MTAAPRIVIVGGGFSGIGMAIRLRQQGIDDFVILERAADLGGTWRDNHYPGCACDVPSTLYSFSFAPNPDWSRAFSPQAEIWEYLRSCVSRFDLLRHFVFGQEVLGARWDDEGQAWAVTTASQAWRASVLVLANGPLSDPVRPAIPGLDQFAGPVFHSAQWRHEVDLRGKRVAVIGTGASAIQFVPKIQPVVAGLDLYQRTPPWVMPRRDHAIAPWRRALFRAVPALQRAQRAVTYALRELSFIAFRHPAVARVLQRLALHHLSSQVADPTLRAALTPIYTMGCKRVLLSDDYYPAVAQPNVSLCTAGITHVEPQAITDSAGVRRPADVIVLSTGFRVTDIALGSVVVGRGGRSLDDVWAGSPSAYRGVAMHDFPNLVFLLGPNTGLGHSSVVLMVEAQIAHVLTLLDALRTRHAGAVQPSAAAQARWVSWVDTRMRGTVWNAGGCQSWYLDRTGRNSALYPERVGHYRALMQRFVPDDYEFLLRRTGADAPTTVETSTSP